MDKRVVSIARVVRERVKDWTRCNGMIEEDLCGACAIASYTLWRCLRAIGYEADLVMGWFGWGGHCWVQIEHTVIDITATQFGNFPEVFVFDIRGRRRDKHYHMEEHYVNREAVEQIIKWDEQSPLMYKDKIKRFVSQQRKAHVTVSI